MKKNIRSLKKEEIIHLARLANLRLTDAEIKKYQDQLTKTLDYVNNLSELNTDEVGPTNNVTSLTDIFFEDGKKNERNLTSDKALKNTRNKKNNFFSVKRILQDNVYDE